MAFTFSSSSLLGSLKKGLSFGRPPEVVKSVSYPLNAFGKLPFYKDFISCGLTDDASREFRDWLSDGYSKRWCGRDGYQETPIPPHLFLLRLPSSRKWVAGTLWGSTDQGGLRRFPFALFSVVPGGEAAAPLVALDYLEAFQRRGEALRSARDLTLATFYEQYRGARIDLALRPSARVQQSLRDELSEVSVDTFARSILGDAAEELWVSLLTGIGNAGRGIGAPAVRLPLGSALAATVQLEVFLVYLERRAGSGVVAPTGVLLSLDRDPRGVILFRDLRPEDFLLLHPVDRDYEHVEEAPGASGGRTELPSTSVPAFLWPDEK